VGAMKSAARWYQRPSRNKTIDVAVCEADDGNT